MNQKEINRAAVLICLLVIGVLVMFCVYQFNAYTRAQKQWEQKKVQMAMLQEEISDIKKMIADYEKEKAEFEQLLFNERDIPAFLDEISKFAKMDDVNIVDMQTKSFYQVVVPEEMRRQGRVNWNKPDETQVTPEQQKQQILTLSAMPIDVKLDGTFENLAHFLGRLQDYKQLTNISTIEISSTSVYPKLDCKFTVSIYSLKTLEELKRK